MAISRIFEFEFYLVRKGYQNTKCPPYNKKETHVWVCSFYIIYHFPIEVLVRGLQAFHEKLTNQSL